MESMEIFVIGMFWLHIVTFICRIFNIFSGVWKDRPSLGTYVIDTLSVVAIAIWACVIL